MRMFAQRPSAHAEDHPTAVSNDLNHRSGSGGFESADRRRLQSLHRFTNAPTTPSSESARKKCCPFTSDPIATKSQTNSRLAQNHRVHFATGALARFMKRDLPKAEVVNRRCIATRHSRLATRDSRQLRMFARSTGRSARRTSSGVSFGRVAADVWRTVGRHPRRGSCSETPGE
jgi:hypothetical protein